MYTIMNSRNVIEWETAVSLDSTPIMSDRLCCKIIVKFINTTFQISISKNEINANVQFLLHTSKNDAEENMKQTT